MKALTLGAVPLAAIADWKGERTAGIEMMGWVDGEKVDLRGVGLALGFRMPSREKKQIRDVSPAKVKRLHADERVPLKGQPRPFSRAGNSTRINAFVNTLGRRNQAKRDAR